MSWDSQSSFCGPNKSSTIHMLKRSNNKQNHKKNPSYLKVINTKMTKKMEFERYTLMERLSIVGF